MSWGFYEQSLDFTSYAPALFLGFLDFSDCGPMEDLSCVMVTPI